MPRPLITRDKRHIYYVGEQKEVFPSVTKIIEATIPKPGLTWWGMKVACEGLSHLIAEHEIDIFQEGGLVPTGEQLVEFLKVHKMTVNHRKMDAGLRGTAIHNLLEMYAKTGDIGNPADYPEDHHEQIRALAFWLVNVKPEILCTEQYTASVSYCYAGQLDMKAKIKGKIYLIDLKTTKSVYPESHFPQLEAYENAERECGELATDYRAILHLPSGGGDAKLVRSNYDFGDFEVLLNAYEQQQMRKKGPKPVMVSWLPTAEEKAA